MSSWLRASASCSLSSMLCSSKHLHDMPTASNASHKADTRCLPSTAAHLTAWTFSSLRLAAALAFGPPRTVMPPAAPPTASQALPDEAISLLDE